MEINTTKSPRETRSPEIDAVSEQRRYLRRKNAPQLRKSYPRRSRLLAKAAGILGRLSILLLIAAFLIALVIYAFTSERFTLQAVTIQGCRHQDQSRLESIVRNEFPRHLVRIDLAQLRSRLEMETWTRKAEIRRILPSDLVIDLEERTPTVILEIRGELMIADDGGVLLDKYDPRYGKLDVPVFRGLLGDDAEDYRLYQQENSERVRIGLKMLREFEAGPEDLTQRISEVDLADKGNVRIMLVDDTAEISLGDRDFLQRFRTLMSNMRQYHELKAQYLDIASVDLRFEGQIIYRPRPAPGEQARGAQEIRR